MKNSSLSENHPFAREIAGRVRCWAQQGWANSIKGHQPSIHDLQLYKIIAFNAFAITISIDDIKKGNHEQICCTYSTLQEWSNFHETMFIYLEPLNEHLVWWWVYSFSSSKIMSAYPLVHPLFLLAMAGLYNPLFRYTICCFCSKPMESLHFPLPCLTH